MRLTAEDLGTHLEAEARRMTAFAHDPAHYLHPEKGESPEATYPAHLVYRMRLPTWETALVFAYSVDVKAGRGVRHLSITISVPGELTQGQVNAGAPELLEMLERPVRLFFPFNEGIRYDFRAKAPIPVVDATSGRKGNVHFRTPVTFHFVVDHGLVDEAATREPVTSRVRGLTLVYTSLDRLARQLATLPMEPGETKADRKAALLELHAASRQAYAATLTEDGRGDLALAVESFLGHGSPDDTTHGEPVVIFGAGDVAQLREALERLAPPVTTAETIEDDA